VRGGQSELKEWASTLLRNYAAGQARINKKAKKKAKPSVRRRTFKNNYEAARV
jgi:molybdenum-dependent DNA-binding transcriptional regulator ModE